MKNLQVCDVDVRTVAGKLTVGVRLKAIKQDPRMQRPEARGDGDWVWIGQSDGPCDVVTWLRRYYSFFAGVTRGKEEPFFLARDTGPGDRTRVLTYACGMADVRELWARTIRKTNLGLGSHMMTWPHYHGVIAQCSAVSD